MKHPLRIPGHAIGDRHTVYDDDDGKPLPPAAPGDRVAGRARCRCGLLSPVLPGRNARMHWHLLHRERLAGVPWASR